MQLTLIITIGTNGQRGAMIEISYDLFILCLTYCVGTK